MSVGRTSHDIEIAAPADHVYAVVADAGAWPHTFHPTLHVERTALDGGAERLQIWAEANGEVKSWTSRRDLDPVRRRVVFRQEVSSAPVASMQGEWIVTAKDDSHSVLTLLHEFTAVDDDPDGLQWIFDATERNSTRELADISAVAQTYGRRRQLVFTFADSIVIHGSAAAAYDFLYEAKLWGERLPHVGRIDLVENVPNIQTMSMQTVTKDGSSHVTESIRICFPPERIVYKQTKAPSMMDAHTGSWEFTAGDGSVTVTSYHTVVLNEPAIPSVLGADATIEDAKKFIRNAAGGNSAQTLALAKKFVEGSP